MISLMAHAFAYPLFLLVLNVCSQLSFQACAVFLFCQFSMIMISMSFLLYCVPYDTFLPGSLPHRYSLFREVSIYLSC